ncbi:MULTISPECIES: cysteine hydrolase family protein [Paenibacillus]|uniref:Isochorismatase n=1 Tax=Paenibacillus albilobatus TaxID=2716884 RepID=A0A920C7R5_9BACL|nr:MULTISPECIES: cysteine hydrolase family protein [Paenibacillus]GIO29261.1 isochorismatase [Paenibacillus albilobatus]
MNSLAFLVIDVQKGMFPEKDPVYNGDALLLKLQGLLDKARSCGVPVIYVQHNEGPGEQLETGASDWEIHPSVAPQEGEAVIQKFTPDSFHETNLQQVLTEKGIRSLVIAGLQTDFCVHATSTRAAELGYEVTVAEDVHSTWGQGGQTAQEIIERHNRQFRGFAAVKKASEIEFC